MKVKNDHRSKFSNFKQLEGRSLKDTRASTGFASMITLHFHILFKSSMEQWLAKNEID